MIHTSGDRSLNIEHQSTRFGPRMRLLGFHQCGVIQGLWAVIHEIPIFMRDYRLYLFNVCVYVKAKTHLITRENFSKYTLGKAHMMQRDLEVRTI